MHFCTICETIFLVGGPWKVLEKWLQCVIWTLWLFRSIIRSSLNLITMHMPMLFSQHPVYCVNVVGTQNAHNLISVSTDGKMCSWSLDMLSQPQVKSWWSFTSFQLVRSVIFSQGGTPDFKWREWSNGDKTWNPNKSPGLPTKPKKIPGPKINPQKIPCRIFAL